MVRVDHAKHHTLIHITKISKQSQDTEKTVEKASVNIVPQSSYSAYCNDNTEHVMLSTAIVHIMDDRGETHECRTLLDHVRKETAS